MSHSQRQCEVSKRRRGGNTTKAGREHRVPSGLTYAASGQGTGKLVLLVPGDASPNVTPEGFAPMGRRAAVRRLSRTACEAVWSVATLARQAGAPKHTYGVERQASGRELVL